MEIKNYEKTVFENIKHIDEEGKEFWYARELKEILEYKEWRKFELVINKAKNACEISGEMGIYYFVGADKIVNTGVATKKVKDYKLSRYACYLIVQNSDPRKKVVALGQTYFAVQTRKQELTELEYSELSETDKRFYQRNIIKKGNYSLNKIAVDKGVKNMASFHNAGYKGLYNGETADDIFKRKKLRYREDILDNMGEDELVANSFRINQIKQRLVRENISGDTSSSDAHYEVGTIVREAIIKSGGMLPEDMATPDKSLKLIEKEKKLTGGNKKL